MSYVENEANLKIKYLKCDNGIEHNNIEFKNYFAE